LIGRQGGRRLSIARRVAKAPGARSGRRPFHRSRETCGDHLGAPETPSRNESWSPQTSTLSGRPAPPKLTYRNQSSSPSRPARHPNRTADATRPVCLWPGVLVARTPAMASVIPRPAASSSTFVQTPAEKALTESPDRNVRRHTHLAVRVTFGVPTLTLHIGRHACAGCPCRLALPACLARLLCRLALPACFAGLLCRLALPACSARLLCPLARSPAARPSPCGAVPCVWSFMALARNRRLLNLSTEVLGTHAPDRVHSAASGPCVTALPTAARRCLSSVQCDVQPTVTRSG
jgi:hypothetical protein